MHTRHNVPGNLFAASISFDVEVERFIEGVKELPGVENVLNVQRYSFVVIVGEAFDREKVMNAVATYCEAQNTRL